MGKVFFFKYFQIFNFDLAWKTLRIIPMTESVNRASPTQKRGKKRFVVINTKKINIFFNTNHCHEATHLTAFLFQKKKHVSKYYARKGLKCPWIANAIFKYRWSNGSSARWCQLYQGTRTRRHETCTQITGNLKKVIWSKYFLFRVVHLPWVSEWKD